MLHKTPLNLLYVHLPIPSPPYLTPLLINSRKHPRPPTIRNLRRPIHIRTPFPHQKQRQPRNIIQPTHPPLRNLIRPVRRRNAHRHITWIRARTNDITSYTPLREKRAHHLAQVRRGGFTRVVGEASGDPAHIGGHARDGNDMGEAIVVGVCADGGEFRRVVGARVAGASDFAGGPAAAGVCGFEEGEEGGGDADDGLRVDGHGAGPFVVARDHGVAELRDGFGGVDACAIFGADDAGVVNEDVDVA